MNSPERRFLSTGEEVDTATGRIHYPGVRDWILYHRKKLTIAGSSFLTIAGSVMAILFSCDKGSSLSQDAVSSPTATPNVASVSTSTMLPTVTLIPSEQILPRYSETLATVTPIAAAVPPTQVPRPDINTSTAPADNAGPVFIPPRAFDSSPLRSPEVRPFSNEERVLFIQQIEDFHRLLSNLLRPDIYKGFRQQYGLTGNPDASNNLLALINAIGERESIAGVASLKDYDQQLLRLKGVINPTNSGPVLSLESLRTENKSGFLKAFLGTFSKIDLTLETYKDTNYTDGRLSGFQLKFIPKTIEHAMPLYELKEYMENLIPVVGILRQEGIEVPADPNKYGAKYLQGLKFLVIIGTPDQPLLAEVFVDYLGRASVQVILDRQPLLGRINKNGGSKTEELDEAGESSADGLSKGKRDEPEVVYK